MSNIIEADTFVSFNNYSKFVTWWLAFSCLLTVLQQGQF